MWGTSGLNVMKLRKPGFRKKLGHFIRESKKIILIKRFRFLRNTGLRMFVTLTPDRL